MSNLRAFSGAELCNFLSEHGFERVRQGGSHVIMRRGQVSLPGPLHRQLDRGTLRGMERVG
jgi:predicted RNA binding protein YcfA (HicA-like mRNA interferase family)